MMELPNESYASETCTEVYRGTQNGEFVTVKVLRTSITESLEELVGVSTGVECATRGHGLIPQSTVSLQGGGCVETHGVSVYPRVRWHILPQRRSSGRHTLGASRNHYRVFGGTHRCGSVTTGEAKRAPNAQCPSLRVLSICSFWVRSKELGISTRLA